LCPESLANAARDLLRGRTGDPMLRSLKELERYTATGRSGRRFPLSTSRAACTDLLGVDDHPSDPRSAVFCRHQPRLHSPSNRPSDDGDPVRTGLLPTLHTSVIPSSASRSLVCCPLTRGSLSSDEHSTVDVRPIYCRHLSAPPSSSIRTDAFRRGVCSRHQGRRQVTSDTSAHSIDRVLCLHPSPLEPPSIASSALIHRVLRRQQLALPTTAVYPDGVTRLDRCLQRSYLGADRMQRREFV
jgi:uncharacterized protein YbaR (Trm112 family)